MNRIGKIFVVSISVFAVAMVVIIALGIAAETSSPTYKARQSETASAEQQKEKSDKQALIDKNSALNSGAFSDTTIQHWNYDPERDKYEVYFNDGWICSSAWKNPAVDEYEVLDPVDEHSPAHKFGSLDDARTYLWQQCEVKSIARMMEHSELAPGEIPQD